MEVVKEFIKNLIGVVVLVCIPALLLLGVIHLFKQTPEEKSAAVQAHREWSKEEALKALIYTKDMRTNLCFAISPGRYGNHVAAVPCESIPQHLLTTR